LHPIDYIGVNMLLSIDLNSTLIPIYVRLVQCGLFFCMFNKVLIFVKFVNKI